MYDLKLLYEVVQKSLQDENGPVTEVRDLLSVIFALGRNRGLNLNEMIVVIIVMVIGERPHWISL